MDFYKKYIKYKTKYIELKNLSGGVIPKLNIFDYIEITASYIYTQDNKGVFYFALARKVPFGTRKRFIDPKTNTASPNTGAAKTLVEYCGKWGSFGGSASRRTNVLTAAIQEINEEGGLQNFFKSEEVNIFWKNNNLNKIN